MDKIWAKLYAAAKAVQQERQISDNVLAGGVAAAVLSNPAKSTPACASTPAPRWASVQSETPFST